MVMLISYSNATFVFKRRQMLYLCLVDMEASAFYVLSHCLNIQETVIYVERRSVASTSLNLHQTRKFSIRGSRQPSISRLCKITSKEVSMTIMKRCITKWNWINTKSVNQSIKYRISHNSQCAMNLRTLNS